MIRPRGRATPSSPIPGLTWPKAKPPTPPVWRMAGGTTSAPGVRYGARGSGDLGCYWGRLCLVQVSSRGEEWEVLGREALRRDSWS